MPPGIQNKDIDPAQKAALAKTARGLHSSASETVEGIKKDYLEIIENSVKVTGGYNKLAREIGLTGGQIRMAIAEGGLRALENVVLAIGYKLE